MLVAVLLNHVLDAFGVLYLLLVTWKIAKGYGLRRAFF